jgi:dienelactone hydrolase
VFSIPGCAAARPPSHDSLVGMWHGAAEFHGAFLPFDVRFTLQADTLRATMSAPDLLLLEAPLDSVAYHAPRVRFTTHDDRPLRFEGTLDRDSIQGSAVVPAVPGVVEAGGGDAGLRFVLHRAPPPPAPPYSTREVRIEAKGARLAGTIYVPTTGTRPRPGIVILQGSSTNLRHEYSFYADRFARMGLATLAFDKRGKGASSGDYGAATYDDLVNDGAAAVEFMRAQPEVARERVGIWGLSQGAFIAPMVAARVPSLRFIVAVSPPGMSIGESAAYQDSVRLIAAGFSAADASRAAEWNRHLTEWLVDGGDDGTLDADLARIADTKWRRASSIPARLPTSSARNGWYWRGRTLDPIPSWRRLRVPVLVVFGADDELLPARISAARIDRALHHAANQDFTVRVFPGANHVLRRLPLVLGGKWDWPKAAPGYLELVTRWIANHSGE